MIMAVDECGYYLIERVSQIAFVCILEIIKKNNNNSKS